MVFSSESINNCFKLKFILVTVMALLTVNVWSQSNEFLITGRFKIDGGSNNGAQIVLEKDGRKVKTLPGDARFEVGLDYQAVYIISFVKKGFVTKKLRFDTHVAQGRIEFGFLPFDFTIEIFEQFDEVNMVMFNQPVGKISFSDVIDEFDYDTDYTQSIQAKMEEIMEEVEEQKEVKANKIAEEEKKSAELDKKIKNLTSAAQKSLNSGDPEDAIQKLEEALQIQESPEIKKKLTDAKKELEKKEQEALAKAVAEVKAVEEAEDAAEAKAQAEEEAKAAAEAEAQAEEEAKAAAKAAKEAEAKAAAEAEAQVEEEAKAAAKAAKEAEGKAEEEAKAAAKVAKEAEEKAAAEAKAQAEAEAQAEEEAKAAAKVAKEAKAAAEAEEEAKAAAKVVKEEEEKAEEEAKAQEEADAKAAAEAQVEEEAKAAKEAEDKGAAEAKAQAESEAKAAEEADAQAEEEAKAKAKAAKEAEEKAAAEAKAKAESEAKAAAESEADEDTKAAARATKEAEDKAAAEEASRIKAKKVGGKDADKFAKEEDKRLKAEAEKLEKDEAERKKAEEIAKKEEADRLSAIEMANNEAEELAKSEKQSADEEALANEEKARAEAAKQLANAISNGDALFSAGKLDGAKDEYEKAITLGAGSVIDQKIQKINEFLERQEAEKRKAREAAQAISSGSRESDQLAALIDEEAIKQEVNPKTNQSPDVDSRPSQNSNAGPSIEIDKKPAYVAPGGAVIVSEPRVGKAALSSPGAQLNEDDKYDNVLKQVEAQDIQMEEDRQQSRLKEKYPRRKTVETEKAGTITNTYVYVNRGDFVNVYKKVEHNWGGVFFFIDERPTNQRFWEHETQ